MKIVLILLIVLIQSNSSKAQYPFVYLPNSILDELGTLEIPRLPDQYVSSKELLPINVKWDHYVINPDSTKLLDELKVAYLEKSIIKNKIQLRRIWNIHRQPVPDSTIVYDYLKIREQAIDIPTGYYKIYIHSERHNTYYYSKKDHSKSPFFTTKMIAAPIDSWIYIERITHQLSPDFNKVRFLYKQRGDEYPGIEFYAKREAREQIKVLDFPHLINQEDLFQNHFINLSVNHCCSNKQAVIDQLMTYFKDRYAVYSSSSPREYCAFSDFAIGLEHLKEDAKLDLLNEIEHSDSLQIDVLYLFQEDKSGIVMDEFDRHPPIALKREHIKIWCFPNQDIKTLKSALEKAGFTNLENPYESKFLFSATYNGTFHLEQMEKNFKVLFDQAHVISINMLCYQG